MTGLDVAFSNRIRREQKISDILEGTEISSCVSWVASVLLDRDI